MKNFILPLQLSLSLLLFSGCFEDKSSYGDGQPEVISIAGIEDSYVVEIKEQTLKITPQVSSNKPAEWEYTWGYLVNNQEMAVISTEKDLSYNFDLDAKTWKLSFVAKNKLTGLEKIITTDLSLITRFTRGWYVLKDDGTTTEFDLFPSVNGLLPEDESRHLKNALSYVNGEAMSGKGITFFATKFRMYDDDGEAVYPPTIAAISENDFGVYLQLDLKRKRDRNNLAFEPWPVLKPIGCFATYQSFYLCNDGKMYQIELNSAGAIGKFRQAIQLNNAKPDYYLSKHFTTDIAFDEITSSFIKIGPYQTMQYFGNAPKTKVNANNNNLTCLYFGENNNFYVGLFKEKDTGNLRLLKISIDKDNRNQLNISDISAVLDNQQLAGASIMTVAMDEEVLYFVGADGDVYSRMLNEAGTEAKVFETPEGETVTFVKQLRSTAKALPMNYIVVGTAKGADKDADYTVRFFTKQAGKFEDENKEIRLTGKGNPRDVIFVRPA